MKGYVEVPNGVSPCGALPGIGFGLNLRHAVSGPLNLPCPQAGAVRLIPLSNHAVLEIGNAFIGLLSGNTLGSSCALPQILWICDAN